MNMRVQGLFIVAATPAVLSAIAGCAASRARPMFDIRPHENTCEVILAGPAEIGDMRLWVPEGIASNSGFSSIYPIGRPWVRSGATWKQEVSESGLFGPGNFARVAPDTLECNGIRIPVDPPVAWTTTVRPMAQGVTFTIRLTNRRAKTLRKAGAAICLKYLKAPWWSDDQTFVVSDGRAQSLAQLGRDAGPPNGFEAYLLAGESYDNVFYQQFWGFNRHRLDRPIMVSHDTKVGLCVVVEAEHAYFLHSNLHNPCTDVMLAFGDVAPGATAEANGRVRVVADGPEHVLAHARTVAR